MAWIRLAYSQLVTPKNELFISSIRSWRLMELCQRGIQKRGRCVKNGYSIHPQLHLLASVRMKTMETREMGRVETMQWRLCWEWLGIIIMMSMTNVDWMGHLPRCSYNY
jgi:hypothetical protein